MLSPPDEEKIVVKRMLSHFGDGPGLVGLVEHLDDSAAAWRDVVLDVVPEFTTSNPGKPFSMWEDVDEGFRDVVTKMTSLDPARISAKESLRHPWFRDWKKGRPLGGPSAMADQSTRIKMRKRARRVNTRLLITGREDAVYNENMPERGIPDMASRAYGKREFMSSQLRLTMPNMEF
ncbi:hypothetical protein O988_05578 [Pseudogymnoascus sp. VKM F-3808]|nr:hypothetical protein O988_05578 [Pseudogymnoascus sp. VKM F-3808]